MKKFLIGFAAIMLLLLGFVVYTLISTGFFRDINNSEIYEIIAEIPMKGAEDFSISYKDGFMIVSQDDRAGRRDGKATRGNLYFVNLDSPDLLPINLTETISIPFYPHGISLLKLDSNRYQILVVNHAKGHSIEKFELLGDSIFHIQTFKDESIISPNDVIALDSDRFYFTNDHGSTTKRGLFFENYLGLKASNVFLYDGNYKQVASGIAYANGITINRSKSELIVASPRDFMIKYYTIKEDGTLDHLRNLDVGTGVDNLEFDLDGNLWSGAHPSLLAFTSYAKGAKKMAPSEVIKIDSDLNVMSLYENDGSIVSASSVAAPYNDMLIIGTVMDERLLFLRKK